MGKAAAYATMGCLLSALRMGCFLLLLSSGWARADVDIDDSTDLFLTFGQPVMNDTSPYPYHQSISAWYETFLKVALQRKAWPVDAFANDTDFAPIFDLLQGAYPDQTVNDIGDDEWAEPFLLKGQELMRVADSLRETDSSEDAISYYMRAANVFKLAYFPWVHTGTSTSQAKKYAWRLDKTAYHRALR